MIIVTKDHMRLKEPGFSQFHILDENADAEEFLDQNYPITLDVAFSPWTVIIPTAPSDAMSRPGWKGPWGNSPCRHHVTFSRQSVVDILIAYQGLREDHIIQLSQAIWSLQPTQEFSTTWMTNQ